MLAKYKAHTVLKRRNIFKNNGTNKATTFICGWRIGLIKIKTRRVNYND